MIEPRIRSPKKPEIVIQEPNLDLSEILFETQFASKKNPTQKIKVQKITTKKMKITIIKHPKSNKDTVELNLAETNIIQTILGMNFLHIFVIFLI